MRRVAVADVRGLRTPEQRAGVVYVGRAFAGWPAHPLGNPFRPAPLGITGQCQTAIRAAQARSVAGCLTKYRAWLHARPTCAADLAALWGQTGHGRLPLGCWCVSWGGAGEPPMECHAVVLAVALSEAGFLAEG